MTFPDWLDPSEYPFEPAEFEVDAGTMRYVDEGAGDPLSWSTGTRTGLSSIAG